MNKTLKLFVLFQIVSEKKWCPFEEIRAIHEKYIEAANIQHFAFTKLIFAIETQDANEINEVNEMLATARKMMREYEYDINKLANEYDVEITKENDM